MKVFTAWGFKYDQETTNEMLAMIKLESDFLPHWTDTLTVWRK